ncbi:unnamed protein product, partial [Rotaria sp. Silwood2]
MEFKIRDNREQEVVDVLNSFQSHFWLNKHRWFVRCYWYSDTILGPMRLYTLPYVF